MLVMQWSYILSSLFQIAAIVYALKMIRRASVRGPWLLLLIALAIMLAYRITAIFISPDNPVMDVAGAMASLPISILLFASLFAIRKISDAQASADAARGQSEQRYRTLIELSPDAIFVTMDNRITFVNQAMVSLMHAKSQEELIGRSPADFVHRDYADIAKGRLRQLPMNGSLPPQEYKLVRLDGDLVSIESVVARIPWEGGFAYQCIFRDITERLQLLERERTAREQAERASRLKDEFLATLSHELRTPLNAILGWANILAKRGDLDQDLRMGMEVIERNAQAQRHIVSDLLDMSGILSGKMRLDMKVVDMPGVVTAGVDSMRAAADLKGVALNVTLDRVAGPVTGDPNRLQQVVWNLVNNAIKFTPKGGQVDVTLRRADSHVELTVSDTGIGIDGSFLPHVFERFRQAEAGSTRNYGGLGIGLSIVRQLVELHGGSVEGHSDGRGKGARFTVCLPIRALHDAAAASDRNGDHDPSMPIKGIRILVVDDEADARNLIRRLLEAHEASVTTVSSAREAMEALERRVFDVLLSDIGMPELDGYELIRQIRTKPSEKRNIPAGALTAFARSEDRTRALMAGYQIHLGKPIEPQELVAAVAALAGRGVLRGTD
jgi:PAS domain S-box-containing protein